MPATSRRGVLGTNVGAVYLVGASDGSESSHASISLAEMLLVIVLFLWVVEWFVKLGLGVSSVAAGGSLA